MLRPWPILSLCCPALVVLLQSYCPPYTAFAQNCNLQILRHLPCVFAMRWFRRQNQYCHWYVRSTWLLAQCIFDKFLCPCMTCICLCWCCSWAPYHYPIIVLWAPCQIRGAVLRRWISPHQACRWDAMNAVEYHCAFSFMHTHPGQSDTQQCWQVCFCQAASFYALHLRLDGYNWAYNSGCLCTH